MHIFPISNPRNADFLYSQSSESTALISDPFDFVSFAPAGFKDKSERADVYIDRSWSFAGQEKGQGKDIEKI